MATYVLLHGAYQGGWIWQPVATRLRAAGHTVYAPTLDGCGERAHCLRPGITVGTQAQEIASCLEAAGRVLVGPVPRAWPREPADLALGSWPGEVFDTGGCRGAGGEHRPAGSPRRRQPGDLGPKRMLNSGCLPTSRQRSGLGAGAPHPHPRAALEPPMDTFWEQSWPATVIRCTRSVNPPEAHQRRTAERLHAAWHQLETGHYPMLSASEALTGLLVAVAPGVRSR
jgi:hypothetical protein